MRIMAVAITAAIAVAQAASPARAETAYQLEADVAAALPIVTIAAIPLFRRHSMVVPVAMLATYLLAVPVVDLLHGEPLTALGSFGLRVGVPVAGFAVGGSLVGALGGLFSGGGDDLFTDILTSGTVLAAVGTLVATVLDLKVFHHRRGDQPTAAPRTVMLSFGGSFGD